MPERVIQALQAQGKVAGLLEHGQYLRCQLTRPFTEQESMPSWSVANQQPGRSASTVLKRTPQADQKLVRNLYRATANGTVATWSSHQIVNTPPSWVISVNMMVS